MQWHLDTLENVPDYQNVLVWLSYMKGPKVRDWAKKMQYVAGIRIGQGVWSGYNNPAILPWFKQAFELGYRQTLEERKAVKELLKLQMKKGDVETYIKKFETLRRSVNWLEENDRTITQFQRGLGTMHTHEIHEGKTSRPITLKDWYAAARNQWKEIETKEIHEEAKEDARTITPVASAPIIVRAAEVRSQMSKLEVARWRQALAQRQTIAEGKR